MAGRSGRDRQAHRYFIECGKLLGPVTGTDLGPDWATGVDGWR